MSFAGLSLSGELSPIGVPRDFIAQDIVASLVEYNFQTDAAGNPFQMNGPATLHCAHCEQFTLHTISTLAGNLTFKADAIMLSGVIDNVSNDSISPDLAEFKNFTTLYLNGVTSNGTDPYRLTPISATHAGPGLIDVIGSKDYVWTVDGQGAVGSNSYMKRGEGYSTLAWWKD